MTTITIDRATVEQALQALEDWDSPVSLPAITALRAALAQQAEPGEPVAWAFRHSDGTYHDPSVTEHSAGMVPLYTAPPKRKPLTEGALMGVYIDFDRRADTAWSGVEYLLRLCRAVERAHGITGDNNG